MKSRPAVYDKGCLGKNILVHLVQRVPELGHTHPIQIKDQGIETVSYTHLDVYKRQN